MRTRGKCELLSSVLTASLFLFHSLVISSMLCMCVCVYTVCVSINSQWGDSNSVWKVGSGQVCVDKVILPYRSDDMDGQTYVYKCVCACLCVFAWPKHNTSLSKMCVSSTPPAVHSQHPVLYPCWPDNTADVSVTGWHHGNSSGYKWALNGNGLISFFYDIIFSLSSLLIMFSKDNVCGFLFFCWRVKDGTELWNWLIVLY